MKYCDEYQLGYKNTYKKEMGKKVDCENPFEPDYLEYGNYWDGLVDGKYDAKMDKLKRDKKHD
jgi:hypothetical protein